MASVLEQYDVRGRTAREIASSLEDALRTGALRPRDALPTVRGLAGDLGVSPATVAAAYRELARRGLVVGAGRGGTRVRDMPPVAGRLPMPVPAGVRDLRTGGPDPALLPRVWRFRQPSRPYGEASVAPELAEVATRQFHADGIDAANLAVVSGALDGVERVLLSWLRAGDRVAVEDPGYPAVLDLVAALGLETVAVSLDDRGMQPDSLATAIRRDVRAVVVTPRAQNPTGVAWDGARAGELRAVLADHPGVLVVEDDHAGPAAGVPTLTICPGSDRWATIRSVSKWLGPDLRVAVVAGDPTTVSRVEGRQALGAGWVSYVLQGAVADLWRDHGTADLLERAAGLYANRRDALRRALGDVGFGASGCSGLTTWVRVSDEHSVVSGLIDRGWAVSPGERYRIVSPPGIRIAFATLAEEDAPLLADAIATCTSRRPVRSG